MLLRSSLIFPSIQVGPNQAHVALMTFNDVTKIQFDLNQYHRKQDVMQAVEYVKFKGGKTNTATMFELMITEVFRQEKGDRPRKTITVMTLLQKFFLFKS